MCDFSSLCFTLSYLLLATTPSNNPSQSLVVSANETIAEIIYDLGLNNTWQDWGWAPRDTVQGQDARLNFSKYAGWILVKKNMSAHFSALTFRIKVSESFGDFLEVRLSGDGEEFPRIALSAAYSSVAEDGWKNVRIPMQDLNPSNTPFFKIIFRAHKNVDSEWVFLNKIILWAGDSSAVVAKVVASHQATAQIYCKKPQKDISPLIYGIAYSPRKNRHDGYLWQLGSSIRRWGGNPASRYNWQLGNAWNTGFDWFYMNVNYTGDDGKVWQLFLEENHQKGVKSAITVPLLGWVAKNTESVSFPTSVYGPQKYTGGSNHDIGNGIEALTNKPITADPRRTSIPAPPEFVGQWVKAIRDFEKDKKYKAVDMYILDNEPALWNSTHRDVHPEPLTYDELLERTIAYGHAVRQAAPDALIAGPAEWGWPAYFFSAKDQAEGFSRKPDRRAHGDVPLLAWYLRELHQHEKKTGEKILDVLDVHFYPQVAGTYGKSQRTDTEGNARRLRSTRSLWDKTYKDESWINDTIYLIPRLQELIDQNYPGLKISIGEYNFGGEKVMSGALALAETLGRFAQGGVYSAFYWTYPEEDTATYHTFRAFRNYDKKGSRFLDKLLTSNSSEQMSLYASTDESNGKIVAIVLNLDQAEAAETEITLNDCGEYSAQHFYQLSDPHAGLVEVAFDPNAKGPRKAFHEKLPPYSLTVIELQKNKSKP